MAIGPLAANITGYNYPLVPLDRSQTPATEQASDDAKGNPQAGLAGDQANAQAPGSLTSRAAPPPKKGADLGSKEEPKDQTSPEGKSLQDRQNLEPEQESQVRQMEQRDREVRAHEQAHVAAGGRYVQGGASFEYQTGPDGKRYAVGGEVSIDTSKESSPQATILKAQTVKRAANAPAQPSGQDRQVAARAAQMEREAKAELAEEKREQAEAAGQDQAQKNGAANEEELFPAPSTARSMPFALRLKPFSATV